MKRKLIKQGKNALTVTLPARWTKDQGLEAGDSIHIDQKDSMLILGPEAAKPLKKEIEIDISGKSTLIKTIIGAYYKMGYTKIKIHFSTAQEYSVLQKLSLYFVGMGIIEETSSYVVLGHIAKLEDDQLDKLIQREMHQMNLMLKDTLKAIQDKDEDKLKMIIMMDDEFSKLDALSRRIVTLNNGKLAHRAAPLYTFLFQLEKAADEIKYMCSEVLEHGYPPKDHIDVLQRAVDFCELFTSYYRDFELSKIEELKKQKQAIMDMLTSHEGILHNVRNFVSYLYTLKGIIIELNT